MAWATSAMVAARTRLEIATENLANVSTEGFGRFTARGSLTPLGVTIARERARPIAHLPNNVNAIAEMIDVLAAQRSFESAQKAVTAIDRTREKAAEAARIS
ncbi:MAG TPA: flagellar basal body rod C-terminal domain-containing protein [Candidatus Nitrosotalea sp.]|nr:flagellar basal body rod C-terminal domain-containing protein [Candidatus Nitrosotalea sp.]